MNKRVKLGRRLNPFQSCCQRGPRVLGVTHAGRLGEPETPLTTRDGLNPPDPGLPFCIETHSGARVGL